MCQCEERRCCQSNAAVIVVVECNVQANGMKDMRVREWERERVLSFIFVVDVVVVDNNKNKCSECDIYHNEIILKSFYSINFF